MMCAILLTHNNLRVRLSFSLCLPFARMRYLQSIRKLSSNRNISRVFIMHTARHARSNDGCKPLARVLNQEANIVHCVSAALASHFDRVFCLLFAIWFSVVCIRLVRICVVRSCVSQNPARVGTDRLAFTYIHMYCSHTQTHRCIAHGERFVPDCLCDARAYCVRVRCMRAGLCGRRMSGQNRK